MRFLGLFGATLVLGAAAYAGPLTWTLSGLTFNDGGTAFGTFSYNADTNTFSSIDITTTAGSLMPGGQYFALSSAALASGPEDVALISTNNRSQLFNFELSSAMTDSGGTIPLLLDPLSQATSGEDTCFVANCTAVIAPFRFSVNGSLSAPTQAGAPEPATAALVLGGLGCLLSRRLFSAFRRCG
jgi:hypothetical protein